MTIKELKIAINDLPDDMDVLIHQEDEESYFSMSQRYEVRKITFQDEETEPEEWAEVDCFCITDEI